MPGKYEYYQASRLSAAEETAARLADRAERLLKQGMASDAARKHKWATGKEKWAALQREGAIAAGTLDLGKRRGRPRAQPPTPAEQLVQLLTSIEAYQEMVMQEKYPPTVLEGERQRLLAERLALIQLGAVDLQSLVITEAVLNPAVTNE